MEVRGTVVHGKHLGSRMGFPTANIDGPAPQGAENGVYLGFIRVEGYPEALPCIVDQGRHPTVPEGPPTIEAHILDFSDDIYGLRATVTYLRRLRPEQRFDSLEALTAQLGRDRDAARAYFAAGAREDP